MNRDWSHHLSHIILALIALTVIGLLVDAVSWVLLAGTSIYLLWTLRQSNKLHQWLFSPDSHDNTPESHGLWGDLFDGIHQLQQRHETAQERLQTVINRVQESTNALNDAVIMTNAKGSMEWWNNAATRYLGFKRDSDYGQLVYNLIRDPSFKTYFEKKSYEHPLDLTSPYRPYLFLRFHITLFGEDDRLIIAQDISALHRLERMRKDFVSNVSHEMRTPLTVISGYLETFLDHADDLPPRWNRALNTMQQQSLRMERLIGDLLLLANVESKEQKHEHQTTDVEQLITKIKHDAQAFSAERKHNITINSQDHITLRGDEHQLRSAFSNIIFNAVKYTPSEGSIDIHWWSDSKGAHLSVKDNGIGFDPIHIPRLTERFYRADPSRHKETGGSGLGLAIVKHVLLNHEGSLEVKSDPGKGSEFICHFPSTRIIGVKSTTPISPTDTADR